MRNFDLDTQVFLLLYGDEDVEFAVKHGSSCCHTLFTRNVVEAFPDPFADDSLATLAAIAIFTKADNIKIEALMASIRRIVMGKSHHTHTMFRDLLIGWAALNVRKGAKRARSKHAQTLKDTKANREQLIA